VKVLPPVSGTTQPDFLLAFDFDGTLSEPEKPTPVRPQFFELLRLMRETHRVYWGVNTGRSLMQMVQGLNDVGFPFLPDFIIAREREIYTPNDFGRWVSVADWNQRCEKDHRKLFRKHRKLLKRLQAWVQSETSAEWGIQAGEPAGIVARSAAEMDRIVEMLDQELESAPLLDYQRNGVYLRFSHSRYHKGTTLLEVARRMQIAVERTFAIGDSHNDLDMLHSDVAACIACPANACEEVKNRILSHGGYMASSRASAGVVEALCYYFGASETP